MRICSSGQLNTQGLLSFGGYETAFFRPQIRALSKLPLTNSLAPLLVVGFAPHPRGVFHASYTPPQGHDSARVHCSIRGVCLWVGTAPEGPM